MKKRIIIIIFLLLTTAIPVSSNIIDYTFKLIEQKNSLTDDQSFDDIMESIMDRGHFPSISACIIKEDQVVWSQGYGYSDTENSIPATDNTVYQIASVTKTVTGTALMQLYDQGLFDLDDDVNNYLPFELTNPNFPEHSITFRMLLSHSSSLRNTYGYWEVDYSTVGPPFPGYPLPWLEDYLTQNGELYEPIVWDDEFAPGEKSVYANINFDLIAFLVELISEEPFYEYCEKYIFDPLEMEDTSFRLTDYDSEQVAVPYYWDPFTKQHEKRQNTVFIHYPAGGLFTTVSDLAHFMIAHMNGGVYKGTRILNESTINEMHEVQPPGNKYSFYFGLAWLIMARSIWIGLEFPIYRIISFPRGLYSGHGGDISYGLHTRMNMRLSEDVAVIFFINTHRIQRKGWNCAELLNELLFLKSYSFGSKKESQNSKNFVDRNFNFLKESSSFSIIENKIISNTFFINFLNASNNISPIFKILSQRHFQ
jgi:CubicO group peptidase (beta-lactamase class C family)